MRKINKKRPLVGVGVLVIRGNKTLLGKRKDSHGSGEYACPGGHLEFGEKIEEAAKREVFEETGLRVNKVKFLSTSNVIKYHKHYVHISVLAPIKKGVAKIKEPHKVEKWRWYPLNKLPKPLFEMTKRNLESYKTGKYYFPR